MPTENIKDTQDIQDTKDTFTLNYHRSAQRRTILGKKTTRKELESSGMDIPDYVIESIARSLLPVIQAYYETGEGRKSFEEWQQRQLMTEEQAVSD